MGFPYWGEGAPLYLPLVDTNELLYWADGAPIKVIVKVYVPPQEIVLFPASIVSEEAFGTPKFISACAPCVSLTTCENIAAPLSPCISLTTCEAILLYRPADCRSLTISQDLFEARPHTCVSKTTCRSIIFDGGDFFLAI